MKLPARLIAEFLCRLILGGVFVFTGFMKVKDPVLFQQDIRSFHILDDPWPGLLAISLPWLEILAGAGILLRQLYAGSLVLISGSLAVFIGAIAWSWMRGLDVSCGCFGKLDLALGYSQHILLNSVLLGMGIWLLWLESRRLRMTASVSQSPPPPSAPPPTDALVSSPPSTAPLS